MLDEEKYSSDEEDIKITFQKRGDHKMELNETAAKNAEYFSEKSNIQPHLNEHLDKTNRAERQYCNIDHLAHDIEFKHFLVKNKFSNEKIDVFDALRELLIERGYENISHLSDKEEEQVMVIRVISKIEGSLNTVLVEDEKTKEKLTIKDGIICVGMICAVQAKWSEGVYKLEKIIDLSSSINPGKAQLNAQLSVNRIMLVKGPFRPKFKPAKKGDKDEGIRMITNEINKLKKKNVHINELIVMGPILSLTNNEVQKFQLERTYEEEYEFVITNLRNEISRISEDIQIFVLPSLDDITSNYPIPQPAYKPENSQTKVKFISNPSSIKIEGKRSVCKIDLINYDILKYMDTHKVGRAGNDLRKENFEVYFKQPFFLTNSTASTDPIDEVNIPALYNNGEFGDLVIFSSAFHQPFVNEVNGRIIHNIGSLGVETNFAGNNFMSLVSIYEGEGRASERIKIEIIQG